MKKVIIESPFAGNERLHLDYARRAMLDSLNRGEAPFGSHLLYPQVLDDKHKAQRNKGINAGYAWGQDADLVAVYNDHGLSAGMAKAIDHYTKQGKEIEYRQIGGEKLQKISIVVFKWNKEGYRSQFTAEHVNRFFHMIDKNVTIPYRKICITDDPKGINHDIETIDLWDNPCPQYAQTNSQKPNCFYRLKLFDPKMRKIVGDKFVWMDLDAIVVKNIDNLLTDGADFKMWKVDGEYMPCNGSFVSHKTGTRPELWDLFNPKKIHPVTGLKVAGMIGSDQAWIGTQLKEHEKLNTFGQKDGVYSYRCHIKKILERGEPFPENCRIVFFHGRENPWDSKLYHKYKWIQEAYS